MRQLPNNPMTLTPSNIITPNTSGGNVINSQKIADKIRESDPVSDILQRNQRPPEAPDLRP